MSNVRDFVAHVTDGQKKKPNKSQIDKLLETVKTDLQSAAPDYDGCVLALTIFPPQILGMFYEDVYTHFPKDVCALFDTAFLTWAKSRPKIAGGNLAYIKMAQAIKKRLAIVSSADDLLPELQWYISNFGDSRAARETKKIRDECEITDLQKLLALNTQDWHINPEMLKKFYGILFADFTGPTTKKMYQAFLARNHLINELPPESTASLPQIKDTPNGQNETVTVVSGVPKDMPTDTPEHGETVLPQNSTTAQGTKNLTESKSKSADAEKLSHPSMASSTHEQQSIIGSAENYHRGELGYGTAVLTTGDFSADTPPLNESPLTAPQQDSTELGLEKDGVKLAELLLSWSKKQANGTAVLREMLRKSEKECKRLDTQFSDLREELFSVKKELAEKDAAIASLQQELTETTASLNLSQRRAVELDETIQKLQRMNENSASQAVSGYKTELATSLKSIVEDARLPEAQKDADILSALLGDLMDTLRFKGVPLEGK